MGSTELPLARSASYCAQDTQEDYEEASGSKQLHKYRGQGSVPVSLPGLEPKGHHHPEGMSTRPQGFEQGWVIICKVVGKPAPALRMLLGGLDQRQEDQRGVSWTYSYNCEGGGRERNWRRPLAKSVNNATGPQGSSQESLAIGKMSSVCVCGGVWVCMPVPPQSQWLVAPVFGTLPWKGALLSHPSPKLMSRLSIHWSLLPGRWTG